MTKYTVELSERVIHDLDVLARDMNITREDAIRRVLGLLPIANEERRKGNKLAVVHSGDEQSEPKVVAEIAGI